MSTKLQLLHISRSSESDCDDERHDKRDDSPSRRSDAGVTAAVQAMSPDVCGSIPPSSLSLSSSWSFSGSSSSSVSSCDAGGVFAGDSSTSHSSSQPSSNAADQQSMAVRSSRSKKRKYPRRSFFPVSLLL